LRNRTKLVLQEAKLSFACALEKSGTSVVLMRMSCLPLAHKIPFKITFVFSASLNISRTMIPIPEKCTVCKEISDLCFFETCYKAFA